MLSSLALLMATIVSAPPASPVSESRSNFRPVAGSTATATVSIRVISGVRFGVDHVEGDVLGSRRKARLTDAAGQSRDAELLEFQ